MTKHIKESVGSLGRVVRSYLTIHNNFLSKISIGCYFIRYTRNSASNPWILDTVGESIRPRKYKVVDIDEFGIPFAVPILFNNKYGNVFDLASVDLIYNSFSIDPDFEAFLLLKNEGEEYNPWEKLKK